MTGIWESVVTCKFEVHFQGNCQDSQVTHFHSFQLFWYMLLPEFVSWEGTPFAFSSDLVAASGLHYSKSHLLEVHLDSFCDFTSTRKEGPACLKYMLAVVTVNTPSTRVPESAGRLLHCPAHPSWVTPPWFLPALQSGPVCLLSPHRSINTSFTPLLSHH